MQVTATYINKTNKKVIQHCNSFSTQNIQILVYMYLLS